MSSGDHTLGSTLANAFFFFFCPFHSFPSGPGRAQEAKTISAMNEQLWEGEGSGREILGVGSAVENQQTVL